MKSYLGRLCAVLAMMYSSAAYAQLTFSGLLVPAVTEEPPASSGLDAVYVLGSTTGVTATATVGGATNVKVYRFSSLGAAYAQEIPVRSAGVSAVEFDLQAGDMGYMIESAGRRTDYYWVTDYSTHRYNVSGVSTDDEESDCEMLALRIDGSAPAIYYYTINGRQVELERGIEVSYNTLVFDSEMYNYSQQEVMRMVSHATESGILRVAQPLCQTEISVTGDRFLKAWGEEETVSTGSVNPRAVAAETKADVTERDAPNEKKEEGNDALGGSAPCEITFTAAVTDGAEFRQWQIARDEEFEIVDLQFPDLEFSYIFREQGYSYVRFVAANAAGDCEYYGDTYTVYIGDSRLECPNVFSPGASEGVNDEWRVSYKSIVEFSCAIFNRWGVQVATLSDPSQGWDGRYKGKIVPPGVYFYVIEARGADDRKYKLSGDINVIRYKGSDMPPASAE